MAAEYNIDEERQGLTKSLRNQMGYGTAPLSAATKKSAPVIRKFISRTVNGTDTLMGIALKYGVTVGELKRENKLWNSDHLFLRENLLIPLTPENENALDENDSIVVYNGSSILKASPLSSSSPSHFPNGGPAVLEYTSTSGTGCSPETHPASSKKTSRTQSNGTCPAADAIENAEPRSDASDFFNKYDSSIARLKGDVAKLGKNAANLNGIIDANPLALPPRKGSSSSSRRGSNSSTSSSNERRGRFLSEEGVNTSPVLMIRSRTNNKQVKTAIENLEQVNDDIFEL